MITSKANNKHIKLIFKHPVWVTNTWLFMVNLLYFRYNSSIEGQKKKNQRKKSKKRNQEQRRSESEAEDDVFNLSKVTLLLKLLINFLNLHYLICIEIIET